MQHQWDRALGPAGFQGPWIESYFISHFMGKNLSFFNGIIPLFIQWTDIHVGDMDRNEPLYNNSVSFIHKEFLQRVVSLLRTDVMYLAVTQDDQGGFGHIPIPLIKGELNYSEAPTVFENEVGFFGTLRPRLSRSHMLKEIEHDLNEEHMRSKIGPSDDWIKGIQNSKYNLAPRGYGRTSYRLSEIIQLGRIPVYMYDDHPWLPYEGTESSLSTFGFSGKTGQLHGMVRNMKETSNVTYLSLLKNVSSVRTHYTYEGIIKQIEMFFKDPLGPSGGQLRCTRLPDTEH